MRHNLLLLVCLSAALLPVSLCGAAIADTPASHSGSASGHTDSHSAPSPSHTDSHSAPSSSSSSAHTDAGKSSGASGTPSSSAPSYPAAAAPAPSAATAHSLPDYGGRDGIAGTTYAAQSSPALNPLAQAWRAFEALAIVLALVVGGLYGLKRCGLIKPDGSAAGPLPPLAALSGFLKTLNPMKSPAPTPGPAAAPPASWITMIGSQLLPNAQGASLHLVSLGGKTLLLGVTGQSVSLLSEVESNRQTAPLPPLDTGQMPSSFDGFLMHADQSPLRQSNETELLMNATTMRLQTMIARSEGQTNGHRS